MSSPLIYYHPNNRPAYTRDFGSTKIFTEQVYNKQHAISVSFPYSCYGYVCSIISHLLIELFIDNVNKNKKERRIKGNNMR
jgi:hypothetical protein